jgi:hypothetical protein
VIEKKKHGWALIPAPLKHKFGIPYNVRGNSEMGWAISIPRDAYIAAMQPKHYTCAVMSDGTLVYQPVKP